MIEQKKQKIQQLKKQMQKTPEHFRELNAEIHKLNREIDDEYNAMWSLSQDEEKEFIILFESKDKKCLHRDDEGCYFERCSKYPVRLEVSEKDNQNIYSFDVVPFVGY